ncbi:YncE family protein [Candidatus Neomarinimicrobiota bacterium]
MNKYLLRMIFSLLSALIIVSMTSCDIFSPDENHDETDVEPTAIYVLCEGNFGNNNSSLWQINTDLTATTGNLFQSVTDSPLGDTGQSLTIDGKRLYIVMNGSGSVEVMERSDSLLQYVGRVDLTGSSPREMAILNSRGYVTCWYINAVLAIDLSSLTVTDTIFVPGMPEDILAYEGALYVALPLQTGWYNHDQVVRIDPVTSSITAAYVVSNGPQQLAVFNDDIYVARQWYDESFTSYRGIARINPGSNEVLSKDWGIGSGVDIFSAGDVLYLVTGSGIQPLKPDLTLEDESAIGADVANLYAAGSDGSRIFIASSDFINPGLIQVYDTVNMALGQFTVGINPGSFAFFK